MTEEQKQLEHYKKLFGVGDVATRAYLSVVNILEQQVGFLENFQVKDKIVNPTKDDPVYERAIKIYEGMTDNVLKLNKLRLELGIDYDPENGKPKVGATSPQSIGKTIDNV